MGFWMFWRWTVSISLTLCEAWMVWNGSKSFWILHLKRTRASRRFCCNYSGVTPHISGFTRSLGAEGSCDRQNFLLADKQNKPERPVEVGHFWSFQQAGRHCYFEVDIQRLGMHFGWGGGLSRNYGDNKILGYTCFCIYILYDYMASLWFRSVMPLCSLYNLTSPGQRQRRSVALTLLYGSTWSHLLPRMVWHLCTLGFAWPLLVVLDLRICGLYDETVRFRDF